MDVRDRAKLEAELARKLGKVNKAAFNHLIELLGDPPRLENVPAAFWMNGGSEMKQVVIPFFQKVFLQQAGDWLAAHPAIGVDWALVNTRAVEWASKYAGEFVKGITDTTKDLIEKAVSAFYEQGLTRGQLEDMLLPTFGPIRAEMIAVTEVTRASVEGEMELWNELKEMGFEMDVIWMTDNDELVCDICYPLNETKQGEAWTDPPPAHPRCRCTVGLQIKGGGK